MTKPIAAVDFCVLDTETTGGRAEVSRVIEVAVVHYRDGIILDRFQSLLNPGSPIPDWITALTGIDNGMVRRAPAFADIAPTLLSFLDRGVFVAHNAAFDYAFISAEFARLGLRWQRPSVCTVRLARQLFPELPSRSLGALCDHLLIDIYDRHRAAGDAEATVYVLKHLLQLLGREHGVATWTDLEAFCALGPLALPSGVTLGDILRLPAKEGRFVFRDESGGTVLEGTAKNVRQRVQNYFRRSNRSARAALLRAVARSVEAIVHGAEEATRGADAFAAARLAPAIAAEPGPLSLRSEN